MTWKEAWGEWTGTRKQTGQEPGRRTRTGSRGRGQAWEGRTEGAAIRGSFVSFPGRFRTSLPTACLEEGALLWAYAPALADHRPDCELENETKVEEPGPSVRGGRRGEGLGAGAVGSQPRTSFTPLPSSRFHRPGEEEVCGSLLTPRHAHAFSRR